MLSCLYTYMSKNTIWHVQKPVSRHKGNYIDPNMRG